MAKSRRAAIAAALDLDAHLKEHNPKYHITVGVEDFVKGYGLVVYTTRKVAAVQVENHHQGFPVRFVKTSRPRPA